MQWIPVKEYREVHLLADLGWVDLDLECSSIFPNYTANSANFLSAQAELGRQWNNKDQIQPNEPMDRRNLVAVSRLFDLIREVQNCMIGICNNLEYIICKKA